MFLEKKFPQITRYSTLNIFFPRILKTFKKYPSCTRRNTNHSRLFSYNAVKKNSWKKRFHFSKDSVRKGGRRSVWKAFRLLVSGLSPELRKKQISLRKGSVYTGLRYRTSLLFRTKWHTYVPLYSEHSWNSQTATYRKAVLFWRVGFPYHPSPRDEDESRILD